MYKFAHHFIQFIPMKPFKVLLLLLIINPVFSFGQILSGEPINVNSINPWLAAGSSEYEGLYSFGFSEAESELRIAVAGDLICVQLQYGQWKQESADDIRWQMNYKNYHNVRIEGNKFFSKESNGEFVLYQGKEGEIIKCLKLFSPPTQTGTEGQYEIGIFRKQKSEDFPGRNMKTYFEVVDTEYLDTFSAKDLRIMRNELFAGYGYIFREEGEVGQYFAKQAWYRAERNSIDGLMTEIEKVNLKVIQDAERRKKN